MTPPFRVKVCGLTDVDNAVACARAGADAIGINFCAKSKRYCSPEQAQKIAMALQGHALVVGLFVDATLEDVVAAKQHCKLDWVQLHGEETKSLVQALGPNAYKAIRGTCTTPWPGPLLMVDAPGDVADDVPGGHGRTWTWSDVRNVARGPGQCIALAGGLRSDNVQEAIRQSGADAVDVASGVERRPGIKDIEQVRRFVEQARACLDEGVRT